jgi:hypothetical protein
MKNNVSRHGSQVECEFRRSRERACFLAVAFFASAFVPGDEARSPRKITATGKLTRFMGIGGETSGWALQLKREMVLEGKKMDSIEISGAVETFEKLKNQRVRARGTLTRHKGVERGEYPVLEVSSIQPVVDQEGDVQRLLPVDDSDE